MNFKALDQIDAAHKALQPETPDYRKVLHRLYYQTRLDTLKEVAVEGAGCRREGWLSSQIEETKRSLEALNGT